MPLPGHISVEINTLSACGRRLDIDGAKIRSLIATGDDAKTTRTRMRNSWNEALGEFLGSDTVLSDPRRGHCKEGKKDRQPNQS